MDADGSAFPLPRSEFDSARLADAIAAARASKPDSEFQYKGLSVAAQMEDETGDDYDLDHDDDDAASNDDQDE